MSRTVHHIVYNQRDSTRFKQERDAQAVVYVWRRHNLFTTWEWHQLFTLRYSAAALSTAKRAGSRPRPQKLRLRLEAYNYPRTYGIGHAVSGPANRQERSLRTANRSFGNEARKLLRGSHSAVEAAWDMDFPDPRHRHFGLWDSW